MKSLLKLFILISIFSFFSCDILRFSLFEVVSWSPGDGYHSEPENIVITLNFSHIPHKPSIEKNFSLTADGNRIKGNFLWEEKRMLFIPVTPLETNIDYVINLSAEARNTEGLSLDEAFIRDFTTRKNTNRPEIISCYPPMYAEINESRSEIKLEFSLPVNINTLYENISFSPSMNGLWHFDDNSKLAIFTPSEPWLLNSRYEIRISSSLTDTNGMNIRNEFKSIFTTKINQDSPYLLHVKRITHNDQNIELLPDKGFSGAAELPVENNNLDKNDRLLIIFSQSVDSFTLKNLITIENGPNLAMETTHGFKSEFIFKFENTPVYESRFTLKIKPGIKNITGNETKEEYIYKIFANGIYSKPPELTGIRIPMAPNNIDSNPVFLGINSLYDVIPIKDDFYPSSEITATWIELYFSTAEGASIDKFSLMELFRIDTSNNVLSFSPRQIHTSEFSFSEPHPGCENYQRIEITGYLINSTNYGIINFHISSGLKDSLGNRNEKSFSIPVIK